MFSLPETSGAGTNWFNYLCKFQMTKKFETDHAQLSLRCFALFRTKFSDSMPTFKSTRNFAKACIVN